LVWPASRGARAVCLYHHARLDLVVEWFGGPPVAEVAAAFLAAGLDLQPRDRAAQGLRDGTWPEWTLKLHAGTMELVLCPRWSHPTKLPGRHLRHPPIGHDRRGHGGPVSDGDGRLRPPKADPDVTCGTRP
jgi:hypothetical protein